MKWNNASEQLPEFIRAYGGRGNTYQESNIVITNLGVGVYRKVNNKSGKWCLLDAGPKYGYTQAENVTWWMTLPEKADDEGHLLLIDELEVELAEMREEMEVELARMRKEVAGFSQSNFYN